MTKKLATALVGLFLSAGASAATTGFCNTYLAPDGPLTTFGIAVTDMTYSGNTPTVNADNCFGVVEGNDEGGLGTLWGGGWTLVAKSDEASKGSVLNGIDFTVVESDTGTWTLTGSGTPLPQFFDFVGVLKQGNGYAAYLFDDARFDGTESGTYVVKFNGKDFDRTTFDLSHLTIYARTGEDPDNPGGGPVPEPASLALVGLGMLGLAAARRRRSA